MNTRGFVTWAALALAVAGCSQGSLSERDARLEQLRLQADAKRRELGQVAGDYQGTLIQDPASPNDVALQLKIVDVPTSVEGQPEPVLMPALAGSFTYYLGPVGGSDFFVYAISRAGYDPNASRIEIQASNPQAGDLLITLFRTADRLEGTWTAPGLAVSGTLAVKRVGAS